MLVEFNIKAKPKATPAPIAQPKVDKNNIQLEVGKKYVLFNGTVIGPMLKHKAYENGYLLTVEQNPEVGVCLWYTDGGRRVGEVTGGPTSIEKEWKDQPTLEEFSDAWWNGTKVIEYQWINQVDQAHLGVNWAVFPTRAPYHAANFLKTYGNKLRFRFKKGQ